MSKYGDEREFTYGRARIRCFPALSKDEKTVTRVVVSHVDGAAPVIENLTKKVKELYEGQPLSAWVQGIPKNAN